MSSLLSSQYAVWILASEGTYGTDAIETILDADGALTYLDLDNPSSMIPVSELFEPDRVRASHSGVPHSVINNHMAVELSGPLKGKEAAGAGNEAPLYSPILLASNFAETVVSATSATYALKTAQQGSFTAYHYRRNLEDNLWRLVYGYGIRGSTKLSFGVNVEPTFTFGGLSANWVDWSNDLAFFGTGGAGGVLTDQPILENDGTTDISASYTGTAAKDTVARVLCHTMTITLGATTYPLTSLDLDLAWNVAPLNTMNNAATNAKTLLTRGSSSRPNGTFLLLDGATAYEDVLTKSVAGTEAALQVIASNATSSIQLDAAKVQLGIPTLSDQNGVAGFEVPFFLAGNFASNPHGEGDLTLTYT